MPVSETVWGLLEAESVSVSVPLRVPVAVGEKVTETLQLAPAPREVPQLLLCAKSPLAATEVMVTAPDVPFETVTDFAVEVVPVCCEPKLRLMGETEKDPELPLPTVS